MPEDFEKIFDNPKAIPEEFIEQVAERVFEILSRKHRRLEFKSRTLRIGEEQTEVELAHMFNEGWEVFGTEKYEDLVLFTFCRKLDSTPVYKQ